MTHGVSDLVAGQEPQLLLTLPPAMARCWDRLEWQPAADCFVTADPPGGHLGSGGATAHVLHAAWQAAAPELPWSDWLRRRRRMVLHGGGQSRRLPAYAVTGKPMLPLPVLRWSRGQRLDQTLLDVQLPDYARLFDAAPASARLLLASGDVLVQLGQTLARVPEADVVGVGVCLPPEVARQFGVFFVPRSQPNALAFFLQKPTPDRIRDLAGHHAALADSGIWLLSARAVEVLMRKCGWPPAQGVSEAGWVPEPYDFYGGFGLALGCDPAVADPDISGLSCAVLPLPEAGFHHLGTSRQLIEAVSALHNENGAPTRRGFIAAWGHPDQHLQNSRFEPPLRRQANHTLWVENCTVPATWRLACEHVLSNVPENQWDLTLEPGACLDFVPVDELGVAVRFYGIDDTFRGAVGDPATLWLGQSVLAWLEVRGLDLDRAGLNAGTDAQDAPLFPVEQGEIDPRYIEWLLSARPAAQPDFVERWATSDRLSAAQLMREANVPRLLRQRADHRLACLDPLVRNARRSVFFQLDLDATARLLAAADDQDPLQGLLGDLGNSMQAVREQVVRAAVLRHQGRTGADACEADAFERLRDLIEAGARLTPVIPRRCTLADQIVWGRSPVRLDLAGGWTDTPPYCLENGGRVVNVAVDLNGQPPLQVFVRVADHHELVIRSIDLGAEHRIRTYAELDTFAQPGSEFALAQAAFALAGFLPRFHAEGGHGTLEQQLRAFGGGIELSLLAAVPRGSGLGTSSILAATLLASLGDLCGLGWDRHDLFARTLALEQMVTTGGGWQDQAGGLFPGIKLVETQPGLVQRPTLRWLPDHLFSGEYANQTLLLYYTGLTRLAKGILHEVVRGVFLNAPRHLEILGQIGAAADLAFQALQEANYGLLASAIRKSWELNQDLDRGTNPPAVEAILAPIGDYLAAAKLLGAGGGGYLLMLAKDAEAAGRIRGLLRDRPPNAGARFVNFALSSTGLQLTRS